MATDVLLVPQPKPVYPHIAAMNAAPRCTAHTSRTKRPCRMAAIRGMRVCKMHGGHAPQVRAAAALRLALAIDPALRAVVEIVKDKKHPQRLAAAREILERNRLEGFGTPPRETFPQVSTTVQISAPTTLQLEAVSDEGLDVVDRLLRQLLATTVPLSTDKQLGD